MSQDDDYIKKVKAAAKLDFLIPALETAKEFNNVNVRKSGDIFQIQLTLTMEPLPDLSKAWKTAVALDASASMRKAFGRRLTGNIPTNIGYAYEQKGWLKKDTRDGCKVKLFSRPAVDDAIGRGLVSTSPNTMDFLVPEFITYLSQYLDIDGETTLIYWAGGHGGEIEDYGNVKEDASVNLLIDGPEEMMFGKKTLMLPAFKYLLERFDKAPMAMFVFISDGRIDDLPALKQYTVNLAREIADNRHNLVKCILIVVGDNDPALLELETLASITSVNIWDYIIVNDLREVLNVFAEVIRNTQIVAKIGTIYDDQGNWLKSYPAGVPATIVFLLPITCRWFELELADQHIRQIVKVPEYILGG